MFATDSADYHVLTAAVNLSSTVEGATCEIGLREGGGSWYIMEAMCSLGLNYKKPHIAIDPYGDIPYKLDPGVPYVWSPGWYTNQMRNQTVSKLYNYANEKNIDFHFFNLEDVEFFARYADGVPIYQDKKTILNKYSLVHFDGAHTHDAVLNEILFFHPRTDKGAVFVFDDVVGWYDHEDIHKVLYYYGWSKCIHSERKWAYIKTRS
jgi:cephalosporin hydroxylase